MAARRSRATNVVTVVVALALTLSLGWWAGRTTLAPPASASDAGGPEVVLATVADVSVGRSLNFNVTASQPFVMVASNALTGVVTSAPGTQVDVGGELYSVAGVPVRAVVGTTPFYRDLTEGVEGVDVTQLQQALRSLGYLRNTADGDFGPATTRAVRAWQTETGQTVTGAIPLGTLVALPSLPTTVRLGEDVTVGGVLAGGEPAVLTRTGQPEFALVLTSDQASLIPAGARVDVQVNESLTWTGAVGAASPLEDGSVSLAVDAPDGSLLCGDSCGQLPPEESISLAARVEVEPAVSGPGIPATAVRTDGSGATTVELPDGTTQAVTVLGSGDGLVVIDGLAVGTDVVLSAASSDSGSTSAGTGR